jgi:4-amino-4-deoxy-L-arabinose transferase-like glycosyltransferase
MTNKTVNFALVIILILAAFLRLWGSWRADLFTYDQARDATFIRRIFVEGKIPLIGPQSSIPGVSLGPGYYYMMALPLLAFSFDPAGVDIFTGIVGVLAVWLLFKTLARVAAKEVSLTASLLFAVSPIVTELTRRAWNLSTLPFFFIAMVYLLLDIKEAKKPLVLRFVLLFFLLGLAIQLHYSALLLIPPVFLVLLFVLGKKIKSSLKPFLAGFLVFFSLNLPILLFNIRHNFVMPKAILKAFGESGGRGVNFGEKAWGFLLSFWHLFEGTFLYAFRPVSLILFAVIISLLFWSCIKKKPGFVYLTSLSMLVFGVLGAQFYPEGFSFFYFVFLLPAPYFLLALVLERLSLVPALKGKLLIVLSLPLAVWLFYHSALIVLRPPVRTRADFLEVAEVVTRDLDQQTQFNLVAVYHSPGSWENYYRRGIVREDIRWDHNAVDYGYFIEKNGFKPLAWDNFRDAQVLYLIAETEVKEPLKLKFWEIDQFGPQKIVNQWQLKNGTTVYKLER